MTEPLASWPRRHFTPGGGDAFLFYKVHGTFPTAPEISRASYRTEGVPAGCELTLHTSPDRLQFGLEPGPMQPDAALAERVAATPQCLILRGTIADPPTLDYFRDAIGLVTALLDAGGVAVFDPQMFRWWTPEAWRASVFDPAGAVPRHHVAILVSDEPDGGRWYHTRGLRKFGRPDLSIHHVTPALEAAVVELCNRFIETLAFGAVVPEGQPIRVPGIPAGWRCHHAGDLDDPDFNNVHIEID